MKKNKLQLFATAVLFLVFTLQGFAQETTAGKTAFDTETLDEYIKSAKEKWNIPGMAIAVVHKGELIFEKGYGMKSVKTKEKVTPNTLFAIASNTKAFTSAALSRLVDEGEISWDDPVRKYLPYFTLYDPYVSEHMTIRDLLCHRSGLKTFSGDLLWYGTNYTRKEVIERARYLEPTYDFRTNYGYSNIMFITAGEIIPAVTDTAWEDYIEHHFFKPLEMKTANTSITDFTKGGDIAQPHHVVPGEETQLLPYINWDNIAPAGAINSGVSDMSHWLLMQLNDGVYKGKRILSEKQIHEMRTPHTVKPVSRGAMNFWKTKHFEAYALGWNTFDYHGMQVVEHGGGADGMISKTVLLPEADFGFVILTNSINYLPSALSYYILDLQAGAESKDWSSLYHNFYKRNHDREIKAAQKSEAERNKNSKPSLSLKAFVGIYSSELYGDAEVKLEGENLVVDLLPAPLFIGDLSHWQYNTFKIVLRDRPNLPSGTVNFILDANGEPEEMRIDIPNPDFDFTELEFFKVH
ncbi:MAG: serine hydrolase [Bacteroidota bacterium]|nr:serine hydrolase [Bacteroidota bacterium]